MSAIVGFDTATLDVAVAATRGGELLDERSIAPPEGGRPRHAEALLPAVEGAADAAGGWEHVGVIAVGVGPGSFTGLRVGIATARALAQALDRPIVPVGTLDALARGIGEWPGAPGRRRLAVLDARRGEAFALLHEPDGERVWGPLVAAPGELAERVAELRDPPLAAGDGALRFRTHLEAVGAEVLPGGDPAHRLSARHLCFLAEGAAQVSAESVKPNYLRPPDADLWLERNRRGADGE
jgi:tRNA threonylcarbamoyladenosine biosynthesis protein TsaB